MDHDAVAALLGDPTAVISDADWVAIQEHFAVCDLCVAGPAVLAAAVRGELSLLRFGLDGGRSIFRPWWLGGPIVGLVITVGILSYVFFAGGAAQPAAPTATATPTPTPTPTPTATASSTPAPTPTATPTPTPSPSSTPLPPSPTPELFTPTPSPPPLATATAEPVTPAPTSAPTTTPSFCPASCIPTDIPLVGTATEDAVYAQELFRLTNERRAAAGLDPLEADSRLVDAAQSYAEFVVLSRWWTIHPHIPEIHCGVDCRDMYDRARDAGYPPAYIGENVLWGSVGRSAEQAFDDMIAGAHEDPNDATYGYMGIACYVRTDPGPPEYACVQVLAAAP